VHTSATALGLVDLALDEYQPIFRRIVSAG
jgi:hypothetical protein